MRTVEYHSQAPLSGEWFIAWTAPGTLDVLPSPPSGLDWLKTTGPGTAASTLRSLGAEAKNAPPRLDGADFWFRCNFSAASARESELLHLNLAGLATVADVWLNGRHLLRSDNMFVAHRLDVTSELRGDNELTIRCHALDPLLAARRPRPRWRAPMVEHQQLRWLRTSLLGRTPGWSPPLAPVGPWRPITLERSLGFFLESVELRPSLEAGVGVVRVRARARGLGASVLHGARLTVTSPAGPLEFPVELRASPESVVDCVAEARIENPALWWPHTHGPQPLYRAVITFDGSGGELEVPLRAFGFRQLTLDTSDGDFQLAVNDCAVFCRGVCWTSLDAATLTSSREHYERALRAVRDVGMNMVRVCGPMFYEADDFYDLCDELGILVWQDFMFANMDYPEDPTFRASVTAEARQVLGRWQGRPSLAVLCGDSEGEQQAAMWGAPREAWLRPLFRELLPATCRELCPDVPYWPSSASGGAFPHQPNQGTTSYYGVGAYLRGFEDARISGVRFGSETLGFSNVPDEVSIPLADGGRLPRPHNPVWKAGVPRDLGAGWDFEDVRDHYLRLLFGVDPIALRSTDFDRYLALSRVTSGEVMHRAFSEWRRAGSQCRGALVWFLRDLAPGAGWGVFDVTGRPKAALHYLRRVLARRTLVFSDEGLNGLYVHAVNDQAEPWAGTLKLDLFQDGESRVAGGEMQLSVAGRSATALSVAALLEGFFDTTYAFRFGPPAHDLVVARWTEGDVVTSEAFHFPVGLNPKAEADLGLVARARATGRSDFELSLRSRRFAHAVFLDIPGFEPEENYVHVCPGGERRIRLEAREGSSEPRGTVFPLNARHAIRIGVAESADAP